MERARNALASLAVTILKTAPKDEAVVLAWPLVCGGAVAERTQAAEFAAGILTVVVPDKAWQSELRGFERQYLASLKSLVPVEVGKIRFVVAGDRREVEAAGK